MGMENVPVPQAVAVAARPRHSRGVGSSFCGFLRLHLGVFVVLPSPFPSSLFCFYVLPSYNLHGWESLHIESKTKQTPSAAAQARSGTYSAATQEGTCFVRREKPTSINSFKETYHRLAAVPAAVFCIGAKLGVGDI